MKKFPVLPSGVWLALESQWGWGVDILRWQHVPAVYGSEGEGILMQTGAASRLFQLVLNLYPRVVLVSSIFKNSLPVINEPKLLCVRVKLLK